MDEQTLNQQQTTPLASQSSVQAAPRTDLPQGVYDYSEQIASMYDAQQRAKEQSLANAYEQNTATMQREREKISPLYQTQANDLSTQYERNRRNMNFQADLNGLNTGTASQMDLAQNNAYLNSFGKLRASEAEALRAADQQMADLEISYKNAVSQALADNDYQKATALMQEYQRRDAAATAMEQYNRQQQEADAKLKAAYGDFSGYSDLYGAETAKSMYKYWLYNNPDYAYANGLMSANDYYIMTGSYPSGYAVASSSGSYRGGRGGGGGNSGGDNGSEPPEEDGAISLDDLTAWAKEMAVYGDQQTRYQANQNLEMAARAFAENTGNKPGTDGYYAAYSAYKNTQIDPTLAAANANQTPTVTAKSNAGALAEREAEKQRQKQAEALARATNIRAFGAQ